MRFEQSLAFLDASNQFVCCSRYHVDSQLMHKHSTSREFILKSRVNAYINLSRQLMWTAIYLSTSDRQIEFTQENLVLKLYRLQTQTLPSTSLMSCKNFRVDALDI